MRLLCVTLIVLGCGASKSAPPAAPNSSDPAVNDGYSVYVARCNRCHEYPEPASVDEKAWPGVIKRMGDKAKLDPKQRESVLKYVLAAR